MNLLASQIQEEISRSGPITFARFMEQALYAPGLGYYERQRDIGRRGDFYTSVSVGPLFGELLAFQFAEWLVRSSPSGPSRPIEKVQIIEAGAHQGRLAADILGWLEHRRPEIFARLDYCLVEPSAIHRKWQEETLRAWLHKIKWLGDISEAASEKASRIIFSNEFLDAMPVHRLSWNAAGQKWDECCVAFENGKFIWQLASPLPGLTNALPPISLQLAEVLPSGYIIEHSPSAVAWWKNAAENLGHGKLLTIDYGLTLEELFRPERANGTLRTYAKHRSGAGLLEDPGELDLTSHVNFSALEAAGRNAGLTTEDFTEQSKFLTQILAQTQTTSGSFEEWTAKRTKQFQTLTHPDHLGRSFRALIQSS